MRKVLYSIGEVAEILGENVSLVRFWSDTFPKFIHPSRNGKGDRLFSADDVETFRQIHYLVRTGLTLEGVARRLRDDRAAVSAELVSRISWHPVESSSRHRVQIVRSFRR